MKVQYFITLKEGYTPTMETETETEKEVSFIIEAKNGVTADRMVKAIIGYNVAEWDRVVISE